MAAACDITFAILADSAAVNETFKRACMAGHADEDLAAVFQGIKQ